MDDAYRSMIEQAERRLKAIVDHKNVAIQNFEVFFQDYSAMMVDLEKVEQEARTVLQHLRSMSEGTALERPIPETEPAPPVLTDQQVSLAAEFSKGEKAPGPKVTPPEDAIKGEVFTTWSYEAGPDWSGGDEIDDQNRRIVQARLCPNGHPQSLYKIDCQICKALIDRKHGEQRLRLYDMATGQLLSDLPITSNNESNGAITHEGG